MWYKAVPSRAHVTYLILPVLVKWCENATVKFCQADAPLGQVTTSTRPNECSFKDIAICGLHRMHGR